MNDRERLLELAEAVIAADIHWGEMVRVNELAEDILYQVCCLREESLPADNVVKVITTRGSGLEKLSEDDDE